MSKQPEALRLADGLSDSNLIPSVALCKASEAELRRLHALNAELLEALKRLLPEMRGLAMVSPLMREYVIVCEAAIAKAEQQ